MKSSIDKNPSVVVVMVPYPRQSHLNALLQLSRLISSYKIPLHYLASHLHNSLVTSRANPNSATTNPSSSSHHLGFENIHFHDLPIPPPDDPSLLADDNAGLNRVRRSVDALLRSFSSSKITRVVVIHDVIMSYCVPNDVESYSFCCVSAFANFTLLREATGRPVHDLEPVIGRHKIPRDDEVIRLMKSLVEFNARWRSGGNPSSGALYNTCRSLEGSFLDLLSGDEEIHAHEKLWAVWPLSPLPLLGQRRGSHNCLEWLDKQEPSSVLYVSFGTFVTLSEEEVRELALGLEESGTKFIWSFRQADNDDDSRVISDVNDQLPLGFEERVERDGKGMIVREWAPQMEILGHSSTGGFMSHCGWNSCLESLSLGVPVLAWPKHSDQPRNAVLVTEILRAGLSVRAWEERREVLRSSMVKESVERLMKSDQGSEVRKRAQELGCQVRKAIGDGASRMELDSFISHITRES